MIERLTTLLPDESREHIHAMLPKRDFELVYRLDCRNLCADFQEDIRFRFSLGITNLMRKFLGHRGTGLFGPSYATVSRIIEMTDLALVHPFLPFSGLVLIKVNHIK